MTIKKSEFYSKLWKWRYRKTGIWQITCIYDNYPKYVLCIDDFAGGNYEGIKTIHVSDFMLSDEY